MKFVVGLCIVFFGAAGLFAQGRGTGTAAGASRGGAAHGGAVSRTPGMSPIPGVPTHPPNILYPASGTHPAPAYNHRNNGQVYGYPVYVAVPYGGYYGGYYDNSYAAPAPAPPPEQYYQQPTVVYGPPVYPPETAQSRTIINPNVEQEADGGPAPMQPDDTLSKHYLIAFNDHTVYAAVAYWIDGDTIHYFTAGNVHNQASVSLIDRALTTRLNKETGMRVVLPAAK